MQQFENSVPHESDLIYKKIKYKHDSVYTGQVLQRTGQREGKGKMQWSDGSLFEGIWRNDKANGQGRMIFADRSIYEGEWVNGI